MSKLLLAIHKEAVMYVITYTGPFGAITTQESPPGGDFEYGDGLLKQDRPESRSATPFLKHPRCDSNTQPSAPEADENPGSQT